MTEEIITLSETEIEYAGFWIRAWATIIDSFLIAVITLPILLSIYGVDDYFDSDGFIAGPMDFLISYVLPALAVILFWIYRQATPGKMAIRAKIMDGRTGEKPSTGQCIGRCFAYIPATLFFGIGIFWVAFDKRKQGWHDKLAGTVVVKAKYIGADKVNFQA